MVKGSDAADAEVAAAAEPGGGRNRSPRRLQDERSRQVVLCEVLKAGYSPRLDGEDLDHVAVLAEAGASWPPIVVHRQTLLVIDGMHRLRAAQERGDRTIEVEFFDGDADEAFVAAVRANVAHGLPLTLADRKAAARRILGEQPARSDRWIGEVTGLAAGTVAAIRRDTGLVGAQDVSRLGRDGRVRPLNPADGRLRAHQEITARPDASLREIAKAAGVSPATAKKVRDRMRHADSAVSTGPASPQSAELVVPGESDFGTGHPASARGVGSGLDWSLHRLKRDPSLRYSEYGRALLRELELHLRGPGAVQSLMDAAPAHCGYIVASMARECARKWLGLAETLERRLDQARRAQ